MAKIGQISGGGRPFGDIFLVNTPALDNFGRQLYEEQKQREFKRAKQQQAIDAEFAKNMSNIRDADISDLTKAYGDFKLANQMLMRQRGGGTPEQQLDVLRKKANVYDIINKSKGLRQEENDYRKGILSHPDRYNDLAHDYLMERMQTPLSKLGVSNKYKDEKGSPIDLLNGSSYLYKGTDYDFGKALKTAAGTWNQTPYQQVENMSGNLGQNITNYKYLNDPITFKNVLQGELLTNKGSRAAAAYWDAIPEDQKQLVQQQFNDIPIETWEKIYGKKEKPVLTVFNPNSKAEQLANFMAMQHAVNNNPVSVRTQQLYDKNAIMNRQEQERKEAAALRFERSKKLIALNKSYGDGMNFDIIGNYIPKAIQTPEIKDFSGKTIAPSQTVIKVKDIDPYDLKTITNNGKTYPIDMNGEDVFIMDPNNGDLIGNGGQRISRESIARQRSKETPNTLFKRGLPEIRSNKETPKLGEIGAKGTSKNKWDKYKRH